MLENISQKIKSCNGALRELQPQVESIDKVKIPLDADPLSKGLVALNQKLAMIQESKDLVCGILNKVILIKNTVESVQVQLNKHVSNRKAEIVESNSEYYLKTLKTKDMRDDALNKVLRDEASLESMLDRLLLISKSYYDVVKNQLSNLGSTNDNLKYQLKVIDDMIAIGEITR
jgi:hypothetical protein